MIDKPFVTIDESRGSVNSSIAGSNQADNTRIFDEKLIAGENTYLADSNNNYFEETAAWHYKKLTISFESFVEFNRIGLPESSISNQKDSIRFPDEIIITEVNTHFTNTDKCYICELIAWYSRKPINKPFI